MRLGNADRGSLQLVASRVAIFLGTAVSSLVLARVLGPGRYGVVAAATAIAGTILLFGSFGLDQLYLVGALDIAALRVRTSQAFAISTLLCAAGALLWPGVSWTTRVGVVLAGSALAVDYLKLPFLLGPQRDLDFGRRARREAFLRLATVATSIGVVVVWRSALAVLGGLLVTSVALAFPARALPSFDRRLTLRTFPGVARRGLPYAASGALYTAYFQIDMALLASMREPNEVGQYRVAYSLVLAAVMLAVVLNNEIMRPRLYRHRPESPEFARIVRTSVVSTLALGVACSAAIVVLGPALIRLAYGTGYAAASPLVRVLGLAMVAHFMNSWSGNVLVAQHRVRAVLIVQVTLVATNVVGNLVLIPSHGARGAATMTVATEWVGAVMYGWVLLTARRSGTGRRHDDEALPEQEV